MHTVRFTYDLPVAPAAAFYLFVGEIGRWWPSVFTHDPAHYRTISIDGFVGGAITTHLDEGQVVWGQVVEMEPPRAVAWQQWWRQTPEFPSLVRMTFAPIETGSRCHFEHGGWTPDNVHHRQRFVEWPIILAEYVAHTRAHARGSTRAPRGLRGVA